MATIKKEQKTNNGRDTSAMGTMKGARRPTGIVPVDGARLARRNNAGIRRGGFRVFVSQPDGIRRRIKCKVIFK